MTTLSIQNGRIIDPSQEIDRTGNLLLQDGRVVGIDHENSIADQVIDATGKIVCPGLIDLHVSHREPGNEEDETTATATAAALAGGFTSIACMPDTSPVVDNRAAAEFISLQAERAGHCNVYPLGAVTKNHAGEELAEIGQLVEGGAVAFTGGKQPVANAEIMRRALQYTSMFNCPIFNLPQVPELVERGVMHEGYYSTLLGLRGIPAAAEEIMVGRDIALAELTGGRLHLMCISAAHSVEQIRRAKQRGIHVTAEVTPHHLTLTDECLQSFDANYKVNPPLRTPEHIEALIEGLKDGSIDVICSDHQPWAEEKKIRELDLVPFGIVGLETLLPICIKSLIEPGHLDWPQLITKLTQGPAKVLGIAKGTLQPGTDADVTIIDPETPWTIDPQQFRSLSRNTPFAGWQVHGRAHTVIVGGDVRYSVE
jgi:dihydroorotase